MEDVEMMAGNVEDVKKHIEQITSKLKKLEKFVFNQTEWRETLQKNTKLGRKLLMAIKEHSRPDQHIA